jgi:hypothetical protein
MAFMKRSDELEQRSPQPRAAVVVVMKVNLDITKPASL